MSNLNNYYNKFLNNTDDTRLRDLLLLEMIIETQNILSDLLSKNQDPEVLEETKDALRSLKNLNKISNKMRTKLRSISRTGLSFEELVEEEVSDEED